MSLHDYLDNSQQPPGRSNAAIDLAADAGTELPASPEASKRDAEALCYTHPDYDANQEKWKKYSSLYNSKDIYAFLHTHTREHDEMFQKRLKRGYYLNYVSAVVDLYVAYLFHSPITRQPDDEKAFEPIYKDADRRGTRYDVFMQQATTHAQIDGHCGILVDLPRVQAGQITNLEEQEKAGVRPYLAIIKANQIRDWELDADGRFLWVKLEVVRPKERSWNESVDESIRHFVIWTKDSWETWEVVLSKTGKPEKATRLAAGENKLGEVPLVIVRNERDLDHEWFGVSAVRDISDVNIAILNWCSLMDEEIYERCLNVLAIQSFGGNDAKSISLSHNNILEYQGDNPPAYLVPGATPLQLIMEAIDRNKDEIYRLAKLGGDTGLQKSRQATSGIAYAFEFNTTNQSLGKKAVAAEQAEVEVHRLVAKWNGKEFKGNVTYPKEFGVEDFVQALALLADGRATLSSVTAIKELEKRTTAQMFARDPQKLRDKIVREIETTDPQDPTLLSTSLGFGPPEPPDPEGEQGPIGGGPQNS